MDDVIKVIILINGDPIVSKIKELSPQEIGEPDCLLIDPCAIYYPLASNVVKFLGGSSHSHSHGDHSHSHGDHEHTHDKSPEEEHGFALCRSYPKNILADYRMPISSANILTILEPSSAVVSEYLITISD